MYNEEEEDWPSYSRLERQLQKHQYSPVYNTDDPPTTPTAFECSPSNPCQINSCRRCYPESIPPTSNLVNNNNQDELSTPLEKKAGGHSHHNCNRKDCNVGRHSKKSRHGMGSLIPSLPKINFVDLSKIHRNKNMKMCMQTTLVDSGGGSGGGGLGGGSDDYLPLLITSTDDLVLPINAEDSATHQHKKRRLKWSRSKEAFTKFLDTLTRTFCLPLLG